METSVDSLKFRKMGKKYKKDDNVCPSRYNCYTGYTGRHLRYTGRHRGYTGRHQFPRDVHGEQEET